MSVDWLAPQVLADRPSQTSDMLAHVVDFAVAQSRPLEQRPIPLANRFGRVGFRHAVRAKRIGDSITVRVAIARRNKKARRGRGGQ
jgi:hypothetical protein